jgi:hypothetical protein
MGLEDKSEFMKFYIQSATIPDRTFGEYELKYYGMTYKVAGNEIVTDLNITVINDYKWKLRDFFENWAMMVNDRSTSKKAYLQDLYKGAKVVVQQLGNQGGGITDYTFFHVYPKTVSEIELNMETTDTHETFQVTFGYSYWEQDSRASSSTPATEDEDMEDIPDIEDEE